MITAHNARSTRRRGSSSDGKNDPTRTLGIRSSTSPAGVDNIRGRAPLRWFDRVSVRSCGPAPIAGGELDVDQVLQPLLQQPRNRSRPVTAQSSTSSANRASWSWAIVRLLSSSRIMNSLRVPRWPFRVTDRGPSYTTRRDVTFQYPELW